MSYDPLPSLSLDLPFSHLHLSPTTQLIDGLYAIGHVIGIGTYGEVRYGVCLRSGEPRAIKIVDLARFSEETAALMRKEISILRLMSHPHCIRIVDVHESIPYAGTWCESCACSQAQIVEGECGMCHHSESEHSAMEVRSVMLMIQELAAGGELFNIISYSGCLSEEIARVYFRQLMEGLEYIHGLGIAHRDLKPENLVLDDNFNLKIVDFGLASLGCYSDGTPRQAHDPSPSSPLHHDVVHHSGVGSQPYSAPEVYYVQAASHGMPWHEKGKGYRGEPADVWSAGVILYVMLTGQPPFLRPLAKTYGAHMRRCKFFVELMRGEGGLQQLSPSARDLLRRIWQIAPSDRLSIKEIMNHEWYKGEIPNTQLFEKIVEEKCRKMCSEAGHHEAVQVLNKMRGGREDVIPPLIGQQHGSRKQQHLPALQDSNGPSTTSTPFYTPSASPCLNPVPHSPSLSSSSSLPPSPCVIPSLTTHRERVDESSGEVPEQSGGKTEKKSPSHRGGKQHANETACSNRSPSRLNPTPSSSPPSFPSPPLPPLHLSCLSSLPVHSILDMMKMKLELKGFTIIERQMRKQEGEEWMLRVVGDFSSCPLTCSITISKLHLPSRKQHVIDFHNLRGDAGGFAQFVRWMTTGMRED